MICTKCVWRRPHSHRGRSLFGVFGLSLAAGFLMGNLAPSVFGRQIDGDKRAAAVEWISRELLETYVFPETAQKMSDHIRSRLKDGAYDEATDLLEFSELLTADLQVISNDRHLRVRYAPEPGLDESADEAERQRRREQMVEAMRRDNFAFKKVEHLPGNVGYLKLDAFVDARWGGPTAIAALNFLGDCDALIIDLRENGGGSPSMIQLITSYFFDEPRHINSFYIRKDDSTRQFWTSAHVEGKRLSSADLYVLTSGRTFSAAEEFTYNLKNMKRATIVGEVTGGGAHPVDFHRNPDLELAISLPFGRAVNPLTGTNWEGKGVEPDVAVNADRALEEAYPMALRKLEEEAVGVRAKELAWLTEYHKNRFERGSFPLSEVEDLIGRYGPREITFEDGTLYYQREANRRYPLFALPDGFFGLDGLEFFRIRFERGKDGEVVALEGHYLGGDQDRSSRTN